MQSLFGRTPTNTHFTSPCGSLEINPGEEGAGAGQPSSWVSLQAGSSHSLRNEAIHNNVNVLNATLHLKMGKVVNFCYVYFTIHTQMRQKESLFYKRGNWRNQPKCQGPVGNWEAGFEGPKPRSPGSPTAASPPVCGNSPGNGDWKSASLCPAASPPNPPPRSSRRGSRALRELSNCAAPRVSLVWSSDDPPGEGHQLSDPRLGRPGTEEPPPAASGWPVRSDYRMWISPGPGEGRLAPASSGRHRAAGVPAHSRRRDVDCAG